MTECLLLNLLRKSWLFFYFDVAGYFCFGFMCVSNKYVSSYNKLSRAWMFIVIFHLLIKLAREWKQIDWFKCFVHNLSMNEENKNKKIEHQQNNSFPFLTLYFHWINNTCVLLSNFRWSIMTSTLPPNFFT